VSLGRGSLVEKTWESALGRGLAHARFGLGRSSSVVGVGEWVDVVGWMRVRRESWRRLVMRGMTFVCGYWRYWGVLAELLMLGGVGLQRLVGVGCSGLDTYASLRTSSTLLRGN
jgi:hypothetical protein